MLWGRMLSVPCHRQASKITRIPKLISHFLQIKQKHSASQVLYQSSHCNSANYQFYLKLLAARLIKFLELLFFFPIPLNSHVILTGWSQLSPLLPGFNARAACKSLSYKVCIEPAALIPSMSILPPKVIFISIQRQCL